ncbi:ABC transporter permease [Salibacterium salarium]|uniref:ABC transporter permease n=1 Tax=Salibacterium salarium TaxID=284579 RepID=A0A3R9P747_9BACI|nr:ABC transporter permease subunit [Salibacterium salarium]RSL34187.1 ABC transporter permease [Salibacterium salarium]
MANFFQLVKNEQYKIYVRKSTWAMYIIASLIIIGMALMFSFSDITNEQYQNDEWKQTLQDENAEMTAEMENEEVFEGAYTSNIERNNYYLENDIQPASYDAWQLVMDNEFTLSLVSLFTIIVAAGIVANEFRWGTIKLLLIRPISRLKILLSKYVSVLLFALFTLLYVLAFSWVVGALLFGVNPIDSHIVISTMGNLEYVSVMDKIIEGYGFQLVTLLMMATLAFAISTIFRQSSLAIGVSIFLMFAGNGIIAFLSKYSWSKYILFANTDLQQYGNGTPLVENMTLGFSITVLAVYYVIFLLLSWIFFSKRDVAGH